ncbi:MAG: hypothetical protein Q9163_002361 [Psora crenata]
MVNKKLREKRQKERGTAAPTRTSSKSRPPKAIDHAAGHARSTAESPRSKPQAASPSSPSYRKYYSAKDIATRYNLFPNQLRTLNTDPLNGHSLLSLALTRQEVVPDMKLAFVLVDVHVHPEWPSLILNSADEEWGGTCLLPDARHPQRADPVPVFILAHGKGHDEKAVGADGGSTRCCHYYYSGTYRIVSISFFSNGEGAARFLQPVGEKACGDANSVAYWHCPGEVVELPEPDGRALIQFEEVAEGEGRGNPLVEGRQEKDQSQDKGKSFDGDADDDALEAFRSWDGTYAKTFSSSSSSSCSSPASSPAMGDSTHETSLRASSPVCEGKQTGERGSS